MSHVFWSTLNFNPIYLIPTAGYRIAKEAEYPENYISSATNLYLCWLSIFKQWVAQWISFVGKFFTFHIVFWFLSDLNAMKVAVLKKGVLDGQEKNGQYSDQVDKLALSMPRKLKHSYIPKTWCWNLSLICKSINMK